MAKDVIITPASGLLEFKDTLGNADGIIQLDDIGNLQISNPGGELKIGDTAANLVIGDGVNSIDIIFEQNGAIRALTGKTLTLGQSDSFITVSSLITAPSLRSFSDTNDPAASTTMFGRDTSQGVRIHGGSAGNYISSLSSSGNPKSLIIRANRGTTNSDFVFASDTGILSAAGFSGPLTGTASNSELLDNLNSTDFARYSASGTLANALASAAWVAGYTDASNVDHIWHDDGPNAWNFNSDSAFKAAANSRVNAGSFYASGNQVFHDAYHPNADTLTTARTLTIGSTGKTFNGSGNVAWSLAEIGAPSTTGAGASGTWGISISGNAATVTNGVYQNQYGSFQVSFTSNINANTNRNAGVYGSYSSAATNTPTTSGLLWNATAGADGSGDGAQIWQDYVSNNLYVRQRWGGSYGSWLTILSASNYNTYAPTKTGTGASGTWGINITGSAATATDATKLPLAGGTMTGGITNSSSTLIHGTNAGASRGYLYNDAGGFGLLTSSGTWAVRVDVGTTTVNFDGVGQSAASLRAPIFYNKNDTGYNHQFNDSHRLQTPAGYIDLGPKNTGTCHIYTDRGSFYFNQPLQYVGRRVLNENEWIGSKYFDSGGAIYGTIFYDANNSGYYCDPTGTSNLNLVTLNGLIHTRGNTAGFTGANDTTLSVRGTPSTGAIMSFHRPGAYAVNFGLDSDNVMKLGGWSAGGVQHQWDMVGNAWAFGALFTQIFYDNNNSAYYCDPNGTSDFINLIVRGSFDNPSDDRLKIKLGNIDNALEKVLQLDGFMYKPSKSGLKEGLPDITRPGLSAQQLQEVLEGVVTDDGAYLGVNYLLVTPLLVEAIKELTLRVQSLEVKLNNTEV